MNSTTNDSKTPKPEFEERLYDCPACLDTGQKEICDGEYRGRPHFVLVRCECRVKRIWNERFLTAVEKTPQEDFGWIRDGIGSITPDSNIHPKQAQVLEFIKNNPAESLYIHGITGSGKSMLGWASWQDAARVGFLLEAQKGNELIKAFRDAEFGRYTRAKLHSLEQLAGPDKWCVFIDEFDKIKLTEYSLQTLFNILDALKSYGHRIIITAKKSLAAVEADWLAKDTEGRFDAENYGADIRRRMAQKCVEIDLRLADCSCGKISPVEKFQGRSPVCYYCEKPLTEWRRY